VKIFILTLESSNKNQELISSLRKFSNEVELVYAISPRDSKFVKVLEKFNANGTKAKLGYNMSNNAISCFFGHQQIHDCIVKSREEWALVLEDDVSVIDLSKSLIEETTKVLDSKIPTVVQLFTRGERFVSNKNVSHILNHSLFEFKCAPGQTAAYLINREAAKLSVLDKSGIGPADWPMWAARVKFYCLFPFLFFENSEGSRIPTPTLNRMTYWTHAIFTITFLNWLKNRSHFGSLRFYVTMLWKPIWFRISWRLRGSPTFPQDSDSGLWVV
jgi:GR25 family glycosyltransferase involved in LPS biosynthesis